MVCVVRFCASGWSPMAQEHSVAMRLTEVRAAGPPVRQSPHRRTAALAAQDPGTVRAEERTDRKGAYAGAAPRRRGRRFAGALTEQTAAPRITAVAAATYSHRTRAIVVVVQ